MKTKKEWACIDLKISIMSDENKDVFEISVTNGYRGVSYGEQMPTLKEILEDFDYGK